MPRVGDADRGNLRVEAADRLAGELRRVVGHSLRADPSVVGVVLRSDKSPPAAPAGDDSRATLGAVLAPADDRALELERVDPQCTRVGRSGEASKTASAHHGPDHGTWSSTRVQV